MHVIWISPLFFFHFFLHVTAKFLLAFDFATPNTGPLGNEGGKVGKGHMRGQGARPQILLSWGNKEGQNTGRS